MKRGLVSYKTQDHESVQHDHFLNSAYSVGFIQFLGKNTERL